MTLNPELVRNLRLEFSQQRLVALPVVLTVVFAVAWFADWYPSPATRLYVAAVVVLYAIILLWGVRKSAGTLARELSNDTWDAQRLSAMSAGELLLGKVLGGASYPIYGATLCLCVAFVASLLDGFNEGEMLWSAEQLRIELLLHTLRLSFALVMAFFIATVLMMRRMGRTGVSVTLCQVLVILLTLNLPGPGVFPSPEGAVEAIDTSESFAWLAPFVGADTLWFGFEIPGNIFRSLTLGVLLVWGVIWARNALRRELQFRGIRWTLAASMLFFLIYFGGLTYFDFAWISGNADAPSIIRKLYPVLFSMCILAGMISYAVLFLAPKSGNEFHRFSACLRSGDIRGAAADLPSWLVALDVTLLALLAFAALVALSPDFAGLVDIGDPFGEVQVVENTPLDMIATLVFAVMGNTANWRVPLGLLGFYGLLIRDLSLVLLLNLSARSGRADLTALLYFAVLYLVLPALLYVIDWDRHVAYLLPSVRFGDGDAIAVHWLQAIAMFAVLLWRWRSQRVQSMSSAISSIA